MMGTLVMMLLTASRSPTTIRIAVMAYETIGAIVDKRRAQVRARVGAFTTLTAAVAAVKYERAQDALQLARWADDGGAPPETTTTVRSVT